MDGLMPNANGDPRDSLIALFSAVRKDYGPAGIRVEVGHVGILPVWEENNRNEIAAGRTKTQVIRPVLIDRELPALQSRLDELSQLVGGGQQGGDGSAAPGSSAASNGTETTDAAAGLMPDQKKEFVELTDQIKLLTDRRAQILARVGDEYLTAPPKAPQKP